MASSTPFDGTIFLTGAPDEDQPHGNDYQEHQSTRKSMEFINNKEHETLVSPMSATAGGGEHSLGSAKIYYGDYSTASAGDNLPTVRPDGATALDSDDAGRRAYDTNATYGGIYYTWSGSAWDSDGIPTLNADTSLVGNAYFLDDDTMSGDDATKVASQQSIKAFVASSSTDGYSPTSETADSNSKGTTTLPNGLKLGWGFQAIDPGAEIVTPNGSFNRIYSAVVAIENNTQTDYFPLKIGTISNSSFTIQNTNGVELRAQWQVTGR